MAAKLSRVLIPGRPAGLLLLALCGAWGCRTPDLGPAAEPRADRAESPGLEGVRPVPPPRVAPLAPRPGDPLDLGPEILLPKRPPADEEVARVGDVVLRRSDAFERLLAADPKTALSAVDLLVFDVLIANHAKRYGIRVDPSRVEAKAQQEEDRLAAQVAAELPGMGIEDYVWRVLGMKLSDWRRANRLRAAQRLYQGYVIRYLGLREDRVLVRYIVHRDRAVLQGLAQRVREGADFATLARRYSEDENRRDGGLLPAFGAGFPHAVASTAMGLRKGDLSDVFARTVGGVERYFLVLCLDRFPGRNVSFEEVRAEIEKGLEERPITPIETNAYILRWRGRAESGAGGGGP
ncbi:MAG: hypothetical protein Fur0037_22360 [Planctomycetota bacterium]